MTYQVSIVRLWTNFGMIALITVLGGPVTLISNL